MPRRRTCAAAELHHEDVDHLSEHPAEARETSGRGVAADAGVDHLDGGP
jgi:hypothetical protein